MLYQLSHVRVHPYLSNRDLLPTSPFVGIDVGAARLHVVALDDAGGVTVAEVVDAGELPALVARLVSARQIAIDSPDRWSTAPHAGNTSLSPKFRLARCAEIGLARARRVWVPWTTPVSADAAPGWIRTGVALFAALRAVGHEPLEVYPYAAYRVLNSGGRLAEKRSAGGRQQRRELLVAAGVDAHGLDRLTTHDLRDAAVAAVVARDHAHGHATPATCGHDGSAIWLPASPPS